MTVCVLLCKCAVILCPSSLLCSVITRLPTVCYVYYGVCTANTPLQPSRRQQLTAACLHYIPPERYGLAVIVFAARLLPWQVAAKGCEQNTWQSSVGISPNLQLTRVGAVENKDEWVRFWGQKVKGQGHCGEGIPVNGSPSRSLYSVSPKSVYPWRFFNNV